MKLNPFVMMRVTDKDNAVIFDPQNNRAMSINKTGIAIWEALAAGKETDEIIGIIISRFNVDKEIASTDVMNFLNALKERGLISE